MLISKKKAHRMIEEAVVELSLLHDEIIFNSNKAINDLRKERDALIRANVDLKRELNEARKSLDSLMIGINEEPTCDDCVRAGKYHSKCDASCLRNPHAVDMWMDFASGFHRVDRCGKIILEDAGNAIDG